ncbi:hypothetical protein [Ornithobacterium rhinotracheale]|uniref:hypothetical protein n=1 Tax=Ornithobacterium rhinotracheale TaxID=28251 RepID=UPI001FF49016|nr:hypothetical protein [Ornithobacterium rhinotracheale]MCK0204764.1 hypothetical protein [Ornithobacterium rhinotracheale]
MKKIILFSMLVMGAELYAQDGRVGINTIDPQATLDVNGNAAVRTMENPTNATDKIVVREATKGLLKEVDRATLLPKVWYNNATTQPATALTEDIYHSGKVAVGRRSTLAKFYIYNDAGISRTVLGTNTIDFAFYTKIADGLGLDATKESSVRFYSNLTNGSFTNLAVNGDKAIIFSTDGDGAANSTERGLVIAPHVTGKDYGLKIFEQGFTVLNHKWNNNDKEYETMDIGGTLRVRELPLSGSGNKRKGTETAATPFIATKTVVADDKGVLGTLNALPSTYSRKTAEITINQTTNQSATETTLGNLSVRYAGTSASGNQTIEIKIGTPSHVSVWGERMGSGYAPGLNPYARSFYKTFSISSVNDWTDTGTTINPSNKDMVRFTINLHNSKEVYRVSVVSNDAIGTSNGIPAVPAQITFFIEKLD